MVIHSVLGSIYTHPHAPPETAVPVAALAPTAGQPNCPKCGRPMTGGAPHGPWPVQWECRPCNVFLTGHGDANCPRCGRGKVEGHFGEAPDSGWCDGCGWPEFEKPYQPTHEQADANLAAYLRERAAVMLAAGNHDGAAMLVQAAEVLERPRFAAKGGAA